MTDGSKHRFGLVYVKKYIQVVSLMTHFKAVGVDRPLGFIFQN